MALSLTDEIKQLLYSKNITKPQLDFEHIVQPTNILNLIPVYDILEINKIVKSKKLSAKPKEKFSLIRDILYKRGFKKLAAGTNRIAFKYMEDQSFIIKVAFRDVALSDNIRELYNQHLLKPFVTKVFDVTPCGTIGLFERVNPISSREQFMSVASDIYDIIINHLLGQYVIADFGSKYFMNWGVRNNQFPVLLDFPYVFELDGSKLFCNKPDPISKLGFCGGEIDYDDGFNFLICKKCGKNYNASDLRLRDAKSSPIIVDEKGDLEMKVIVEINGKIVSKVDTEKETVIYEKTRSGKPQGFGLEKRQRNKIPNMKVKINNVNTNDNINNSYNNETKLLPKNFTNKIEMVPMMKKKNGDIIKISENVSNNPFSDNIVISENNINAQSIITQNIVNDIDTKILSDIGDNMNMQNINNIDEKISEENINIEMEEIKNNQLQSETLDSNIRIISDNDIIEQCNNYEESIEILSSEKIQYESETSDVEILDNNIEEESNISHKKLTMDEKYELAKEYVEFTDMDDNNISDEY